LCPFDNEKAPSFTVSREKQIFYCFGCGERGDVFAFLMRLNNTTFLETLKFLANRTGVVLPNFSYSRNGKNELNAREQIIQINQVAADYYTGNLFSPNGKDALKYLAERGLKESTIKIFGLGYALDGWRHLKNHLEQRRLPLKSAKEAGLIIAKDDRSDMLYDRFRNRLMFPVKDIDGRIIAFGGRIMGKGEPKYLNSPESPVYTKGRQLFGLNQAKEAIRNSGYVILVEGYFDLIVLWDNGIKNVVATLGTALTKDHIALIKRYADRVAVIFDSDEAGRKALARSVGMFIAAHMDARAVILPEGLDPDDFVRRYSGEALKAMVEDAPSIVDYYIENVIGGGNSFEEKGEAAVRAATFITGIEDAIDRNLFIKRVSEKLGIDQDILKKEVNKRFNPNARKEVVSRKSNEEAIELELKLIHLMMDCPSVIPSIVESKVTEYFLNKNLKSIGEAWIDSASKPQINPNDAISFIQRLGNADIEKTLLKLLVKESPFNKECLDAMTSDMVRQVKRKWYKEQRNNINDRLLNAQTSGDQTLMAELVKKKEKLIREERDL
jgi:DNA primase